MTKTAEEQIEELSSDIQSIRELKTLIFHSDDVYKQSILPSLSRVPSDIREHTVDRFNHFWRLNRKIIAYLWKKHLTNDMIIRELEKDPDIKSRIEGIREEVDTVQEEMGE